MGLSSTPHGSTRLRRVLFSPARLVVVITTSSRVERSSPTRGSLTPSPATWGTTSPPRGTSSRDRPSARPRELRRAFPGAAEEASGFPRLPRPNRPAHRRREAAPPPPRRPAPPRRRRVLLQIRRTLPPRRRPGTTDTTAGRRAPPPPPPPPTTKTGSAVRTRARAGTGTCSCWTSTASSSTDACPRSRTPSTAPRWRPTPSLASFTSTIARTCRASWSGRRNTSPSGCGRPRSTTTRGRW